MSRELTLEQLVDEIIVALKSATPEQREQAKQALLEHFGMSET